MGGGVLKVEMAIVTPPVQKQVVYDGAMEINSLME
jgi:hypothetical protein